MKDLILEVENFDDSNDITNAYTPPASWYRDSSFDELDKSSLFLKQWQYVAGTNELSSEGAFLTGTVANRPYVLVNEGGNIRALYNVCSHHGTCVAKGRGVTKSLVCPYHGWQYGLSGKLKKIPRAGAISDLRDKDLDLKEIPLKVVGSFIFLYLGDGDVPRFSETLEKHLKRPLYGELNFIKRIEYKIDCNWKVFVDNYLDGGYHVPHMHPGLSSQLDLDSYRTEIFETHSIQYCKGVKASAVEEEVEGRVAGEAEYTWAFPNFMINRYGKWMDINTALPINKDQCLVIFDYFHEENPEKLDESLKASHKVQVEDMEICHMVQAGLKSGVYNKGVYAPQFEKPMYHFHKLLKESYLKELS